MFSALSWDLSLERTKRNEALCLSVAAGLHVLALMWNPIVLSSGWHAPHEVLEVSVVEEAGPGAPVVVEKPVKMSLLKTLQDMLSVGKTEEIAHVAPAAPISRMPQQAAPVLQNRARNAITPAFQPHSVSEDIAAAHSPAAIAQANRVSAPAPAGPSLKGKSFGGIRSGDLPFQVGTDQAFTGGGNPVPIAMGSNSAKSALGYANPSLTDKRSHNLGGGSLTGRAGAPMETAALGGGAPSQINIAGGSNGTAPTGPAGASLSERHGSGGGGGGGLVSRAMFGGGGHGTSLGAGGTEGIPGAAQQLDSASNSSKSMTKMNKGFDITGPITNRKILKKVIPPYPSWAEEQGITGVVKLYFTVTPEGTVRNNVQIKQTTGNTQLDQLAIDALKEWKFSPLSAEDEGKGEWGIITFSFSLSA